MTETLDQTFCDFLEYQLCKAFAHSDNEAIKCLWCDGVLKDQPESHYSIKYINDRRQTRLKAFIGKDGQTEYELILKFGKKALSRFINKLHIQDCVPSPYQSNWLRINTEKKEIEVQLD